MEARVSELEELYRSSKDTINVLKETVRTLTNSQKQGRDEDLHRKMDEILTNLYQQKKLTEATNTLTNVVAEKVSKPTEIANSPEEIAHILETVQRIEIYNEIYDNDFKKIYDKLHQMEARISGFTDYETRPPVKPPSIDQTVGIAKELAKLTEKLNRMEKTIFKFETNDFEKRDCNGNIPVNGDIELISDRKDQKDVQKNVFQEETAKDDKSLQREGGNKETDADASGEHKDGVYQSEVVPRPRLLSISTKRTQDDSERQVSGEPKRNNLANIKKAFEQKSDKGGSSPENGKIYSKNTSNTNTRTISALEEQNCSPKDNRIGRQMGIINRTKLRSRTTSPIPTPRKECIESTEVISTLPSETDDRNCRRRHGQLIDDGEEKNSTEPSPASGVFKCRSCEAELPTEVREDGISVKCTERNCGHRNIMGKLEEGNKWIFTYCKGMFHCHQVPLDTEPNSYHICSICGVRRECRDADEWVALQ